VPVEICLAARPSICAGNIPSSLWDLDWDVITITTVRASDLKQFINGNFFLSSFFIHLQKLSGIWIPSVLPTSSSSSMVT
jgi:hypothetical protein